MAELLKSGFVSGVSGAISLKLRERLWEEMEIHYEKNVKEEFLRDASLPPQHYEKQDLKDLYSMVNLFEGLIFESMQKLKKRKISYSASDKK